MMRIKTMILRKKWVQNHPWKRTSKRKLSFFTMLSSTWVQIFSSLRFLMSNKTYRIFLISSSSFDCFFQGDDIGASYPNLWNEIFLLKVNSTHSQAVNRVFGVTLNELLDCDDCFFLFAGECDLPWATDCW